MTPIPRLRMVPAATAPQSATQAFLQSEEFVKLYGTQPGDDALPASHVLHRAPDASGYAHWMNQLNNHTISHADLLISFSESAENKAALVGVIGSGFEYVPAA